MLGRHPYVVYITFIVVRTRLEREASAGFQWRRECWALVFRSFVSAFRDCFIRTLMVWDSGLIGSVSG